MDCLGIIPSSGILTAVRYAPLGDANQQSETRRTEAAVKSAFQSRSICRMACVFDGVNGSHQAR